jgi:hypothetical protein
MDDQNAVELVDMADELLQEYIARQMVVADSGCGQRGKGSRLVASPRTKTDAGPEFSADKVV